MSRKTGELIINGVLIPPIPLPTINVGGDFPEDLFGIEQLIKSKLEVSNIKAGKNVTIDVNGMDLTINATAVGGDGEIVVAEVEWVDVKNKPTEFPPAPHTHSEYDILNDNIQQHITDADIHVTTEDKSRWNNKSEFDGDYNSLINKPVIENHEHTNKDVIDLLTDENGDLKYNGKAISTDIDLSIYDTHITDADIHVTNEDKISWNNKSEFDGDYNSLINTPEIHEHANKDVIDLLTDENGELKYNGKAISTDIDLSEYDNHIADVDIHVTAEDKETWNNKADLIYVNEQLDTKVNIVAGKDLSTNDFTDEDKLKLDGLENYELPIATPDVLGGIRIGDGLTIDENGVVSAKIEIEDGGAVGNWDDILGKPTSYPPSVHTHTVENIEDFPVLADVATTGDYNNLINTPEIHEHTNKDVIDLFVEDNGTLKYGEKVVATDINLSVYDTHIADVDIHITVEDKEALNNKADLIYVDEQLATKVDKVDGKELSSNDFTDEDKAKLDTLENYDLPIATNDVLGGIKVGTGLDVDLDGVISVQPIMHNWDDIEGKPEEFLPSAHTHTVVDIEDFPVLADVATTGNYADLINTPEIHEHTNKDIIDLFVDEDGVLKYGEKVVSTDIDLSTYDNHIADVDIHVTAEDKETWNNKSEFDGDYNSLINTPEIHEHINKDVIDLLTDDNGVLKYGEKAISTDIDLSVYDAHIANVDIHVTVEDKELWNNKADLTYVDEQFATKVDKVDGKDLSTNDFTDEDKARLDGLENYELPIATADILGGIKVGTGLDVDLDGVISVQPIMHNWDDIEGKPVLADVATTGDYTDLINTPVMHEHTNKDILERINISGKDMLTLDGKDVGNKTILTERQW